MRLGIIIPYRERKEHLAQSAPVLKQFGHIYVVEQMDKKPFNRGKLINAGFLEFKDEFDYFAAHDVDLIPQETGYYTYSDIPCHLATQLEHLNYQMPYDKYFGGVTLFPKFQFELINGFGNEFWGWGAEDDFLRKRFEAMAIPIKSRQCKYSSLPHSREIDMELRNKNAALAKDPITFDDGLTTCKYEIVHCEDLEHYTLLQVKL